MTPYLAHEFKQQKHVMKKSYLLLVFFAGLLLLAGTSCNQAAGNECIHIDSTIEVLDERQGPSVCALCKPENDLHNEIHQHFAWSQVD